MNILINRSDAIGDLLLTLPMAQMIKENYHNAKITFMISEKCFDVIKDNRYVDHIFIYNRKQGILKKFSDLLTLFSKNKFDYYIHVGGGQFPNFMAFLFKIPIRGGVLAKIPSFLFLNKGKRQYRSLVEMHEAEYNLNLLEVLNLKYHYSMKDKYKIKIFLNEDQVEKDYSEFKENVTSKEMIFVHPGMTGHTLNWPSSFYANFIIELNNKYPNRFSFLISQTPSDKRFVLPMMDTLKASGAEDIDIIPFDGSIKGLTHYMSILSKAKLFIGPSTGTTHIANALGVNLVSIYSPIKVQSSLRWGPFNDMNKKAEVLVPEVICGEVFHCAKDKCQYFECMRKIEIEDAVKVSSKFLDMELE